MSVAWNGVKIMSQWPRRDDAGPPPNIKLREINCFLFLFDLILPAPLWIMNDI